MELLINAGKIVMLVCGGLVFLAFVLTGILLAFDRYTDWRKNKK